MCPNCDDGFVEELPESNSSNQNSEDQDDQFMRGVFNEFSMGPFQMAAGNNNTPYFRIANEILGPIITSSLGGSSASRWVLTSLKSIAMTHFVQLLNCYFQLECRAFGRKFD